MATGAWCARLATVLLGLVTLAGARATAQDAGRVGPPDGGVSCPQRIVSCCDFGGAKGRDIGELQLGFQVWPASHAAWIAAAVELKPRMIRFSVGPNWRREKPLDVGAGYSAVRARVAERLKRDEAKTRAAASALRRLEGGVGKVEQLLIVWEPPLSSLDSLGLQKSGTGRVANAEAVRVNANFYVAMIDVVRELGYRPDVVEIANEPDGPWNMRIPPQIYVRLLGEMRRTAKAVGVPLPRIAGPGLAFLKEMKAFMSPPELARRMLSELDVVSVHVWDDRAGPGTLAQAREVRQHLDGLGWKAPILVSEFAPSYPLPEDRAGKRHPGARRAPGEEPVMSELDRYSPATAGMALGLAAEGYNPLVYWELMDQGWGRSSYGLLDHKGQRRPAFSAFAELSSLASRHAVERVVPSARAADQYFGLFSGPASESRLRALGVLNVDTSATALVSREASLSDGAGSLSGTAMRALARAASRDGGAGQLARVPETCGGGPAAPMVPAQSLSIIEVRQ